MLTRLNSHSLGGMLEEVADRRPNNAAILYHGTSITYSELKRNADAAAKGLLALGVRRGDRVGALFGNDPDWLSICFGAVSIGAVFVPFNTWHKKQELEWTIRHSGISVLVSCARFLHHDYVRIFQELIPEIANHELGALKVKRFPLLRTVAFGSSDASMLRWSDVLDAGRNVSEERFRSAVRTVSPHDTAFVLYTSGSTAEPKGVLLQHGSLVENGFDTGERRLITEDDRVWLGGPLFYGLGAANAMPATMTHGAALVLQDYFEPGRAIETIRSTRATVYYGAGAGNMAQSILDHPSYARSKISTLEKGSAGTTAHVKRLTLVEMNIPLATGSYGLTESYGHATGHMPNDLLEIKLTTNGTLLPGFEMLIVDPATRHVLPAGEIGLVRLRGHVTPGYFGNPEETARVLQPDGFFDTGDLGGLDSEGRFIFHSRLKEVIKVSGINVSPLEVEGELLLHPGVQNAYVVGIPDATRGQLIVAFVEPQGNVREQDVKDFLKESVSSFKVPHHVFFRSADELPHLASGKVAKHRLIEEAGQVVSGSGALET